jgi:hypothetical protein
MDRPTRLAQVVGHFVRDRLDWVNRSNEYRRTEASLDGVLNQPKRFGVGIFDLGELFKQIRIDADVPIQGLFNEALNGKV